MIACTHLGIDSYGEVMPDNNSIGPTTKSVIMATCAWFFAIVAATNPNPAVVKTCNAVSRKRVLPTLHRHVEHRVQHAVQGQRGREENDPDMASTFET